MIGRILSVMIRSAVSPSWAKGLAVTAALMATSFGLGGSAPDTENRRLNLLLITLDTTGADHLGCYGDRSAATPVLDRIAAEGALVEHAMTVAPLTLPAHASLLTALYPPRHGIRDNADFILSQTETTLAEHLKKQGYATSAVVASVVLSASQGLAQGFDGYDEPRPTGQETARGSKVLYRAMTERTAEQVSTIALSALRTVREPWFVWIHYFDPHHDYTPPSPYRERFSGRLYDGEIAYMDAQVGRVIEDLRLRGALARTVVAVVGDHGESLGEHGEMTHGLLVYESTLHVPMLIREPGAIQAGRTVGGVVSVVDLAPTLLDLLRLPPMTGIQGLSFAEALAGRSREVKHVAYAETLYGERAYGWAPLHALRESMTKFIEAPEPELFDLAKDPLEKSNQASRRPEDVESWRRRLTVFQEGVGRPSGLTERPVTDERRAQLESLGYVSSTGAASKRSSRPDPKRMVVQNDTYLAARSLIAAGRPADALEKLREVLTADPENPAALASSGALLVSQGTRAEGLAQLEKAARLAPGVYEVQRNLGNALHVSGKLNEAAGAYRRAVAIQPAAFDARLGLGNVLYALGEYQDAISEYREAMRLDPRQVAAHVGLGVALREAGDAEGAERALREAVAIDPKIAETWNLLAIVLDREGKRSEAREAVEKALRLEPDNVDALFNRAKIRLRDRDPAGAREDAEHVLRVKPDHASIRVLLAQVRLTQGDRDAARMLLREFLAQPNADPRLVPGAREMLEGLGG